MRIARSALVADAHPAAAAHTLYFRDSEECLRCISRRATSKAEARDFWVHAHGIAVAIQLEPAS